MRSRFLPGTQDAMRRTYLWLLIFIFFLAACRGRGSFKPEQADATPAGDLVREPLVVSFEELDGDPRAYQNRLLRVTGALVQVPPLPCTRVNGPVPQWALVGEELRLNGRGFERVLRLVPEGVELTVDGFWRRYRGPVGCGKEPPAETIWYLDAVRLVQPNPLPGLEGLLGSGLPRATIQPDGTLPGGETATPTATPSGTPTSTATGTATVTGTPPTSTVTPSPTNGPEQTTTRQATPTPSRTPRPGETLTATPSPTPTPTPTLAGANTPTVAPPSPTSEPPGYPGATNTPGAYD